MIIVEKILGNSQKDPLWKKKLANANTDLLILDQWEAQKSRCRKKTVNGVDIGITLDRNILLNNGDVILFDDKTQTATIVQIMLRDIMVIDLQCLNTGTLEQQIRMSFNLGHALGNQHWKAVIKDNYIYVPLTVNEKVMCAVMKTHGFNEEAYTFVKGESILDTLSHSESRLLFGGAENSDVHVHVEHHNNHKEHEHH